ncbi:MAG: phage tail protein [Rubrivivax sp.]|nr:MAG: phage tail protein [Rubrivivax sp.]
MKFSRSKLLKASALALAISAGLALSVVSLPNGSTVFIASGYGSALPVTILTNASPAVATSAAHGLTNGDFVEVSSGWGRLDQKVCRVTGVTTNTFNLESIDTTSTTIYPAGSGIGSVRKITGYTQLAQILSSNSTGGEQQFATYQFLEADGEKRIPTTKSASGLTFSVADDPAQAGYILASAANDDRAKRAIKIVLSNGGILSYNAYVSINKTPSLTTNAIMAVEATLSLLAEPVRS